MAEMHKHHVMLGSCSSPTRVDSDTLCHFRPPSLTIIQCCPSRPMIHRGALPEPLTYYVRKDSLCMMLAL